MFAFRGEKIKRDAESGRSHTARLACPTQRFPLQRFHFHTGEASEKHTKLELPPSEGYAKPLIFFRLNGDEALMASPMFVQTTRPEHAEDEGSMAGCQAVVLRRARLSTSEIQP